MRTIGIRAAPKSVEYAIYDSDDETVVLVDEIVVPIAFDTPDTLKYVRSNLLDILREYSVNRAGVRVTEPSSQRMNINRIQLEGVILEAFASSALEGYYIGHVSSISSRLGMVRTDFKPLIDGGSDRGIENWAEMSVNQREAILCAMGAASDV